MVNVFYNLGLFPFKDNLNEEFGWEKLQDKVLNI